MNQNQNQKAEETQKPNNFNLHNVAVTYLNAVIRGLIAFIVVGISFWIIFVGYLHVPVIYMLVIAFISSILISPFLNKISLGEFVITKYENWLMKTFVRAE